MAIPTKCEEVVLRVPMYCKGCETRVRKCALKFEGVKYAEAKMETNILTVKGEVDPSEIQVFISKNTEKTVELISSRPKEDPWEVIRVRCLCSHCLDKFKKIMGGNKGILEWFPDPKKLTVRIRVQAKVDKKALRQTLEATLKEHDCQGSGKKHGSKEIVVVKNEKGEKVATAGKQPPAGSRIGAKVAGTNNIVIHNVTIEKFYLGRNPRPPPNER